MAVCGDCFVVLLMNPSQSEGLAMTMFFYCHSHERGNPETPAPRVIPTNVGIQGEGEWVDSRFRGNDIYASCHSRVIPVKLVPVKTGNRNLQQVRMKVSPLRVSLLN